MCIGRSPRLAGAYAFFNDLGLDVIHIYKLDAATAKLTPHSPATWQAPAGYGPRALRFSSEWQVGPTAWWRWVRPFCCSNGMRTPEH